MEGSLLTLARRRKRDESIFIHFTSFILDWVLKTLVTFLGHQSNIKTLISRSFVAVSHARLLKLQTQLPSGVYGEGGWVGARTSPGAPAPPQRTFTFGCLRHLMMQYTVHSVISEGLVLHTDLTSFCNGAQSQVFGRHSHICWQFLGYVSSQWWGSPHYWPL